MNTPDDPLDDSLTPREEAIQFAMAHEQALEDGVPPPELPVGLMNRLDPDSRERLIRLLKEQKLRYDKPGRTRKSAISRNDAVVVAGYEILEELGRGGMGVVYKAVELDLGRVVALKMILHGLHSDAERLARFRAEAEIIARLQHPNIVQIHRIGENAGIPFLALEYLSGGGLDKKFNGVPMRPREAAEIVRVLALALHRAHSEGIIHRDLKPANVLLDDNGVLKVTDFGLAKTLDREGQTLSGTVVGTPEYMSPEQAGGHSREVGPRSDIYSLGVILYEALCGRPPFREASSLETLQKVLLGEPVAPRQLKKEIPLDLQTICLKAMAKEVYRRYETAEDLATDLQLWMDGRPIHAQPPSLTYVTGKFVRRHRIPLAVAWVVLAVIVGVVASAFYSVNQERLATLRANEELEVQLYDTRIAVAERELAQNHDLGLAQGLLRECREDLRGWEWHYLNRLLDGERSPLVDHKRGLWGAEFSPDGRRIATASIDGTVKVWDARAGRLIRTIEADADAVPFGLGNVLSNFGIGRIPIMCLEYSPDGRHIATGSFAIRYPLKNAPGVVAIWDSETGKRVLRFDQQLGVVLSLAYSPDGKRIASSSINPDNTFVVWEADTGKVVKVVKGHKSQIHRLRYSPDGRLIAASDTDGTVRLWNAETFEQVLKIDAHPAPVIGLAFSPDGANFVTGGEDGAVRGWETATGRKTLELTGHTGSAFGVAYSRDGKLIASAGVDNTVRIWDAKTGKERITLRGHTDMVWTVTFSPDPGSKQLLSASFDKTARVWDTNPYEEEKAPGLFQVSGHNDRVNSVAFSPDGRFLASGSWDKDVRLWDARTGAELRTLVGHQGAVFGIAISPDSRRIASASWDHTVRVWDAASGREMLSFAEHTAPVQSVAFSPDGKRIVSGGFDGHVKIWDSDTGKGVVNCDGFIFPVMAVAFSPDGKNVASGGGDRAVKLWDATRGQSLYTLRGHEGSIYGLAFSPDGMRLASASWDHTVKVWNVNQEGGQPLSPKPLLTMTGHKDRVNAVVFAHDGENIASASEDKTARLWNARTGIEIITPRRHRGVVWSVSFSPDGKRLATGCWFKEGWVKSWSTK